MKKIKLNLNKKAIVMLTKGSMENIQGGGLTATCVCTVASCQDCTNNPNCTYINTTTKKEEEDARGSLFAESCR